VPNNDFSKNNFHPSDWQLLGDFEVSSDAGEESLPTGIKQTLHQLELPADFMTRVLESMQDSVLRILQIEEDTKPDHIHVLVFASSHHASKEKTWGFFRIEKIENSKGGMLSHDQTIEFYLYVEGNAL
jgi:hypothetical protein